MPAASLDRPRRSDALPEEVAWRDDGCEVAPRCLACPLPRCRYDVPLSVQWRRLRHARAKLLRRRGYLVKDIAADLGVSTRTAFRILRAGE